jgi:hypothetical protein
MAALAPSDEQGHDHLHLEACPSPNGASPEKAPSGGENVPDGYIPDTAEEKALSRALNLKLDTFLLPFLSLLYLFNGLDRGNVGNAETQGSIPINNVSIFSFRRLLTFYLWRYRLYGGHWSSL